MPPAKNKSDRPLVGISAVVAGLFLFSLQDVAIKSFSDDYSVLEIVVIRGICALLVVGAVVMALLGPRGFIVRQPLLIVSKGLLGFFSYLVYYMAIASLPLADVVAITFSCPLMVTTLSAILVREQVGVRRWLAIVVGLVGVLVVVGPSGKIANIAVAFAALAALTYAISSVIARFIGPEDQPWTVTFYFTLSHFAGGVVVSLIVLAWGVSLQADHPSIAFLLRPWSVPDQVDLLVMVAIGINAAAGFYFLNKAYLSAPASRVAPFEYTYLIWAVMFGYLIWGEVPDATTLAGVSMLIGSNLYILHRELRYRRRQRKQQFSPEQLATQG